jgi:hypothetical protein
MRVSPLRPMIATCAMIANVVTQSVANVFISSVFKNWSARKEVSPYGAMWMADYSCLIQEVSAERK